MDESLIKGERWVRRVTIAANYFIMENKLKKPKPKIIPFDTLINKNIQRSGIDSQTKLDFDIEVKTRYELQYYNIDILLETMSVAEQNKPGWIYTSKADFIAYVWATPQKIMPIGYLIDLEALRKTRIFRKINVFDEKRAKSDNWTTLNAVVPIGRFPKQTLYKFDPNKIPIDDISNWGGNYD